MFVLPKFTLLVAEPVDVEFGLKLGDPWRLSTRTRPRLEARLWREGRRLLEPV